MVMTQPLTQREHTVRWEDPVQVRASTQPLTGRQWLEALKAGDVPPPPAAALLDLRVEEVDEGRVVFSMIPREMQYNPAGTVHGGILTTLADTAMTTAVISMLPAGGWSPTIELKVNFIRPVTERTGKVLATGRVVHLGAAIAVAEADITDEVGQLLARATSTCSVRRAS